MYCRVFRGSPGLHLTISRQRVWCCTIQSYAGNGILEFLSFFCLEWQLFSLGWPCYVSRNSALFSMYFVSFLLLDTSLCTREGEAATVVIAAVKVVGVSVGKGAGEALWKKEGTGKGERKRMNTSYRVVE